jgi:hypothetical protein
MTVEWITVRTSDRVLMQAWLVCAVPGSAFPVKVLRLGSIAAQDIGDTKAELAFWRSVRDALSPESLLQPETRNGALTFSPRRYSPGERDAIEQELAQKAPTPQGWETTQSWVD